MLSASMWDFWITLTFIDDQLKFNLTFKGGWNTWHRIRAARMCNTREENWRSFKRYKSMESWKWRHHGVGCNPWGIVYRDIPHRCSSIWYNNQYVMLEGAGVIIHQVKSASEYRERVERILSSMEKPESSFFTCDHFVCVSMEILCI
jgi:hypothetical protein